MRCTLLSCFAKRARWGKLPIASSTLSAGASDATLDLKPPTSTAKCRASYRSKNRSTDTRMRQTTARASAMSPARPTLSRFVRAAAPSPLLRASARHRRRARDGASAAGLACTRVTGMSRPCAHNAARQPMPVPSTTRHARTCNRAAVGQMVLEQVTTVPRRQARGGHVACARSKVNLNPGSLLGQPWVPDFGRASGGPQKEKKKIRR